ncbi:MAG: SOS response-associated peptidase family protein [Spirochaetes bacterium]|nr:SOS response-associated peptidase family protein [Spirochaetota bacterium]
MCGRFGFIYPSAEDWADATADLEYTQEYKKAYKKLLAERKNRTNIAPTQIIPTIAYSEKENSHLIVEMRWGWEPVWRPFGQLHNANFQTVLNPSKPTWKKDFVERRCIIPASFTYDWQVRDDGKKIPWKLERSDGKLMFLAALWQYDTIRKDREKKVLTVAMMTQHGNKLFQMLNNDEPPGTQPILLESNQLSAWLNPEIKDPVAIASLIRLNGDDEFKATPLAQIGNDETEEYPVDGHWVDPYAVKTEYYSEPTETRYSKPEKKTK